MGGGRRVSARELGRDKRPIFDLLRAQPCRICKTIEHCFMENKYFWFSPGLMGGLVGGWGGGGGTHARLIFTKPSLKRP